MDNASETQQKYFWKYVSRTINKLIKDGKNEILDKYTWFRCSLFSFENIFET